MSSPAQSGLLEKTDGAAGNAFTTTFTVADALEQLPTVAITVYVPADDKAASLMIGFRVFDVKPFGPVQL